MCPIAEGMSAAGRAAMPTFHNAFEVQQYHWHWQVDAGTDAIRRKRSARECLRTLSLIRNAYPRGTALSRDASGFPRLF